MLTVIESPYAGDIEANVAYARACMRAVLLGGGVPFASHLLYTQPGVLRDEVPEDRALGMRAGWSVYRTPKAICAVCLDRGVSSGMISGVRYAMANHARVLTCSLWRERLIEASEVPSVAGALLDLREAVGHAAGLLDAAVRPVGGVWGVRCQ